MTYNEQGKRTSLENLAGQVTTTAWDGWFVTYNGENRPVLWECVSPNSSTPNSSTPTLISMSYDRMGRRVTKNAQRFVYDGYLQIANFEHQTSNIKLQTFIWDPTEPVATRPLAWLVLRSLGEGGYYTHDGNKNVSEVVAEDGVLTAHYDYSPFGETLVASGPLVSTFTHRFSTKYHDNNSGLGYWGYRWYESQLGRWMSRDPLQEQGGVSLFAFANNSAILYYDSLGESIGGIWDFLKKYANPYEIYQQLKNVYGKFRNVACPKIKALQNTDIVNCGCGLIGVADVASSSPLVERVDCLCNVLSSFGQMCDTGISSWQFWAYSALTTLDCASAPVAMVLGGLIGEAVYPVGGGVIGSIIGATPAGDAVIDVAAMALQNMVSQGTPLPMSQGKSCCNLIMTAVSELWGFEDSAGCECQKCSNP